MEKLTLNQLIDLECAQDTFCFIISCYMAAIYKEKTSPDQQKIAKLEQEAHRLEDELEALSFASYEAILRTREKYSPISRALFEDRVTPLTLLEGASPLPQAER